MSKCDMCSSPNPIWVYHCAPFTMFVSGEDKSGQEKSVSMGSDNQWYACDICKQIIESGDKEMLAERSLTKCPEYEAIAKGKLRDQYKKLLLAFHRTFWSTKSTPELITEDV